MKARTVIILVICGALLLTVAAFGIFFARGGEILVQERVAWSDYSYSDMIVAEERVAEEIAKMHFSFSPTPNVNICFFGGDIRNWRRDRDGHETDSAVTCLVNGSASVLYAFPTGRRYYDISPEECQKQLTREIQSRLSGEADFEYTMPLFDWQTMPEKE